MSATPAPDVARRPRISLRPRVPSGDPLLLVAAVLIALIVAAALLAPVLAPFEPSATDILHASASSSSQHLLGTDELGRDIFSRLLYGARLSLLGPTIVTLLAVAAGTTVAIGSVWVGGRTDRILARVIDAMFAFPSLLIAIVAVSVFGSGLVAPIIALSIAYLPYLARVIRSVAVREVSLPYIDSCRLMGYSGLRICIRHLLPNVRGLVAAQATIVFASALIDLAALSFLGLGTQPPTPDWGTMVSDGTGELINGHAQQSLAAGGAIVLTVVIVNLLSERLSTRAERNTR